MITVRQLIGSLICRDELNDLLQLAQAYRDLADIRQDQVIRAEEALEQARLEHARNTRNLLEKFLVCLETPEIDVRDPILQGISDLSDEIARMEEHAPT